MKKADTNVTVSLLYQKIFVVTVLIGWLAPAIVLLHEFLEDHVNAGTLTFQITIWAQPVVFFALALVIAAQQHTGRTRQMFWAALLTVVGMFGYNAISAVEGYWYNHDYTQTHPLAGSSYWTAFGNEWTMMLISLALYVGFLLWLRGKKV